MHLSRRVSATRNYAVGRGGKRFDCNHFFAVQQLSCQLQLSPVLRAVGLLVAEQCFDIAGASDNVKNQRVLVLDAVNDDVLPNGKASQAGA